MTCLSITITFVMLCLSGNVAIAQQTPNDEDKLFSSDLIAWWFMQEPQQLRQQPANSQPKPDPNPETQPAQNPPSQPGAQSTQSQTPSPQSYTGIVSKDADNFVLKVSKTISYKLDNQQQVQEYEGQRVRVTGTLERSINLIHVDRIEPLF
jgi:ABC-type uncharacterized transport system involved in gliding motility auxiliary subunit